MKAAPKYPTKRWNIQKAKARLRLGDDDTKIALPKAKDWSHITPTEGRTGRKKKAKEIKLQSAFWPAYHISEILSQHGAGTPETNWKFSSLSPFRNLTAQDVCGIQQGLYKLNREQDDAVEIEWNEQHRLFTIKDCSNWIK